MIKRLLTLAAIVVSVTGLGSAQDISGDWQGPLMTPMGELRLVVHCTKQPDGTYKGIMDSPDQAMMGAVLDTITLDGSKVHFTLNVAKGVFDGSLKGNGSISGTWVQGTGSQKMPLTLTKTTTPLKIEHADAPPSDIDGTWEGIYETPQEGKLHITFHIKNTADGLTARADLPEMGVKGWPATSVVRKSTSLKVALKQVNGSFSGKLNKTLDACSGDWTEEDGPSRSVQLKKAKDAPAEAQKN